MLTRVLMACVMTGICHMVGAQDYSNKAFPQDFEFRTWQTAPGNSTLKGDTLWITNDTFLQTANFTSARFPQTVELSDNIYYSTADFANDTFEQRVTFDGSTFRAAGSFVNTVFKRTTDFSFIELPEGSGLNFQHAHLPDTINFAQLVRQKAEINLLEIAIDSSRFDMSGNFRPYNIILYNSDVSKFVLDYNYFRLLPIEDQDGKELGHSTAIKLYEDLLKNFQDRNQEDNYEKLDIELRRYKGRTAPAWDARLFSTINDYWWEYGYAKGRIFRWSIRLLLLFTFFTLLMLPFLQREVYSLDALTKKEKAGGHPCRGLRRLWYAFVYTATVFFKLSLDTKSIRFDSGLRNILGTLYVLLVYMVGVVCLAYMANFVLQK